LYIAAYSDGSVLTLTLFYLLDALFFVALVLSVALKQFSTYGAEIHSPSARLLSLLSWTHLYEGLSLIPIELLLLSSFGSLHAAVSVARLNRVLRVVPVRLPCGFFFGLPRVFLLVFWERKNRL
jgi:hypothetical protein